MYPRLIKLQQEYTELSIIKEKLEEVKKLCKEYNRNLYVNLDDEISLRITNIFDDIMYTISSKLYEIRKESKEIHQENNTKW